MEARSLPAGQGWQWIKQGFALFMQAPLLWVVLLIVCFFAAIALSLIPMIGEPLTTLLMPMVVVGVMAGCRELQRGEALELAHLFSGFQRRTSQLITLGGITLVGQYLIFGLMMLVGGAALVAILMSAQPPEDPEIITQTIAGAGFSVLLGLVLFSILMMAMQFAPLLVYFNNLQPVAAMKLSLNAFTRNMGAFFVYFFTLTLLALLASMPIMLGWLILLPLIFTSLYAAYLDIFPPVVEVGASQGEEFSASEDS